MVYGFYQKKKPALSCISEKRKHWNIQTTPKAGPMYTYYIAALRIIGIEPA